jgi:hypothetical protein
MGNLTITVASDVLKRARIRALEENTSVKGKRCLAQLLPGLPHASRHTHPH